MEHLSKSLLLVAICFQVACGVKGKPLPPLQPAHLGRGEPTFTDVDEKSASAKKRTHQEESEDENPEE